MKSWNWLFFRGRSREKIVSFKTNEGRLFSVTTVPEVTIWFIQRHQPKNYNLNTFLDVHFFMKFYKFDVASRFVYIVKWVKRTRNLDFISVFHCLRTRDAHFISVFHCQYARRYLVMRRAPWLLYKQAEGQCNRQWTNAYKTHYSDNKVKCLERQIELKLSAKLKTYTMEKEQK